MPQVSRDAAKELLAKPLEEGRALLGQASLVGDFSDYESWRATRTQWIERTTEIVARILDAPEEADKFRAAGSASGGGAERWQLEYERNSECLRAVIDLLISLPDRPEFPPGAQLALSSTVGAELALVSSVRSERAPEPSLGLEPEQEPSATEFAQPYTDGSMSSPDGTVPADPEPVRAGQLFFVCGRNEAWTLAVAGLLDRTGPHRLTRLSEQTETRGMLVERFQKQAPGLRYGIILLTADDVGGPRLDSDREPYLSPRAPQGVVFEMGILVAALTPRCVCVLYEDGVELPHDLDGIAYVRLDQAGTWQSKLLLLLRGAGFDYDVNRLAPV